MPESVLNFRWGAFPALRDNVLQALQRGFQLEATFLSAERRVEDYRTYSESLRRAVAEWYERPDEVNSILLTTGSAHGMLQVFALLARPDEVVVLTDVEFPDFYEKLERGRELALRVVPVSQCKSAGEVVERFANASLEGASWALLSSLSYLGHRLPLAAIVRGLRERAPSCRIVIDDSQGFAHAALSLRDLDVDFVASDFHKRAQGAPGTGSLWIRRPSDLEKLAIWSENPLSVSPAHLTGEGGLARKCKHCLSGLLAPELLAADEALRDSSAFKHYLQTSMDLTRRFLEGIHSSGLPPLRVLPAGEDLLCSIVTLAADSDCWSALRRNARQQGCPLWFDELPEQVLVAGGRQIVREHCARFMFDALPGRNDLAQVNLLLKLLRASN